MIIVTGGAGFIGSNLVHALNTRGQHDIWVVDSFERSPLKYRNLLGARFSDVLEKSTFLALIERDDPALHSAKMVFHQGACSSTTERNGRYLLENNYGYSKSVLRWCDQRRVPLVYASSAAVYGATRTFSEDRANEAALNPYGWSKQIFDDYVRAHPSPSPVVGLRYFNVYGPREAHKGSMASVAFHLHRQLLAGPSVRLFEGSDGYGPGKQERDFVYVDDVIAANLWFMDHPEVSGLFNVGTGRAETFEDVARAVIAHHGRGAIEHIPFPAQLVGKYQSFTQADLTRLQKAGFSQRMRSVEAGVGEYSRWLDANPRLWETDL